LPVRLTAFGFRPDSHLATAKAALVRAHEAAEEARVGRPTDVGAVDPVVALEVGREDGTDLRVPDRLALWVHPGVMIGSGATRLALSPLAGGAVLPPRDNRGRAVAAPTVKISRTDSDRVGLKLIGLLGDDFVVAHQRHRDAHPRASG
jgi:hypothetical protein